MKRKSNLYQETYKIENIISAFDEVCRNTKNKLKTNKFKEYKCIYISRIYNILKERKYVIKERNIFKIYEPKERRIVSLGMLDKVVNHLIARHILIPVVFPLLVDEVVSGRPGKGTKKGVEYEKEYIRKFNIKYKEYYILKCDISKFFSNINHDILKKKLRKKIKDKEALNILYYIIDNEDQGLSLGSMTSQILAIFYLNDMDHYIKEELKIKYYVRYQDDFLLFHESKQYLRECLEKLKEFLKNEKLELNRKTRIYKNTNNFIYLGRNKKGKYAKYRDVKRKIRKRQYLYENKKITLMALTSSFVCYRNLCNRNFSIKRKIL